MSLFHFHECFQNLVSVEKQVIHLGEKRSTWTRTGCMSSSKAVNWRNGPKERSFLELVPFLRNWTGTSSFWEERGTERQFSKSPVPFAVPSEVLGVRGWKQTHCSNPEVRIEKNCRINPRLPVILGFAFFTVAWSALLPLGIGTLWWMILKGTGKGTGTGTSSSSEERNWRWN